MTIIIFIIGDIVRARGFHRLKYLQNQGAKYDPHSRLDNLFGFPN